jgi:hypothetical protein
LGKLKFEEESAATTTAAAAAGQQLRSLGIAFDPVKTILGWRVRGLAVALTTDGGIAIDPAAALNAVDVAILTAARRTAFSQLSYICNFCSSSTAGY